MIYKYFLQFSRLPFHLIDGFICCAEAFYFDIVLFVYFCFLFFAFALEVRSKKITSKNFYMNCLLIWAIEKLETYLNYKHILDPLSKRLL